MAARAVLGAIRKLSPFGPIFAKELRITSRRKRTYFLRSIYICLLLLCLLFAYAVNRENYTSGGYTSVAVQNEQQAQMGQMFFGTFAGFSIIAMMLIGPVLTANAISSERLQKTLPVLLMSPISGWQIIGGKLFSRLLIAFTLIGLSLPALAVVRLLGGVELSQMLIVISLCAVTALFSAALGLFFSTFMTRAYAVILLSYATMLFLYAFVPMITVLFMVGGHGRNSNAEVMFTLLNPFLCVMLQVTQMGGSYIGCILVHILMTVLLVFFSAAMLRRVARKYFHGGAGLPPVAFDHPSFATVSGTIEGTPHDTINVAQATGAALPLPLPLESAAALTTTPSSRSPANTLNYDSRYGQKQPRTVSDNPVLWREIRRPLMNKRWQAIVGTIITIACLLLYYLAAGSASQSAFNSPRTQMAFAVIFNGLLMLLLCVVSATAIATERESDTWTLLLVTPISAKAIVLGKFCGILRKMLWPAMLAVTNLFVFTIFGVISVPAFLFTLWILFTFNIIWAATGLYLSLRLKRATFAIIVNLLLPIVAYVIAPIVLAIFASLASLQDNLPEIVGWYLPYPYLNSAIMGLTRGNPYDFYLPYKDSPEPGTWMAFAIFVGIAHLILTAGIIGYTVLRFNKIVGRASQEPAIAVSEVMRRPSGIPAA